MSLSRLALRLAAIEALAPHAQFSGSVPAWPTLAPGKRIFDSQIGAEPTTESDRQAAMISVYTDDSKVEADRQTVLADAEERCTLAFEIIVPGLQYDDTGAVLGYGVTPTDALAEAMLDLIGSQIEATLKSARLSGALGAVLVHVDKIESRPWRDADSDIKLSARRDEFEVRIRRSGAWDATLTGLARLPDPLRTVAARMPAGSYGHEICSAVAALLTSATALPALQALRLAGNIARPPGAALPPAANPAADIPVGDITGSVPFGE